MKLGDKVPFDFLGVQYRGEVIELYRCTGRNMALIKSDTDNMKYPIEIEDDVVIDEKNKKTKKVVKSKKKITKKSRVLDLYESCKKDDSSEVRIPWTRVEEANFSHKDITYFKAVLKELNLKLIRESDSLRVIN